MKKGFTLIEMLVVVGIIGLLSIMSIQGFTTQQRRARDARRIADIGALGISIESYYSSHNSYPSDSSATADGKVITSNLVVLANEGLINNLPTDPKVVSNDSEQFCKNYAYKNSWNSTGASLYEAIDASDGNPSDGIATFNGVKLGPRRWALYMATEVNGVNLHHPLDNTVPATDYKGWCGNERGYAILLGPLQ